MTRIRSPGYPSSPLSEMLELVEKIFNVSRQNVIDREAAVRDIGYKGLTGQSTKMLANMAHFNLIEKAGKGGLRVSDVAIKILHPKNPAEKAAALEEAAYSPELFNEIRQQWPDGFVSENALRGHLLRSGFSTAAIQPAISSYLETYSFLQQALATESYRNPPVVVPESASIQNQEEPPKMQRTQHLARSSAPVTPAAPTYAAGAPNLLELALNEPNWNIRGDIVHIEARLDREGLAMLEKQLEALKLLIKPSKSRDPHSDELRSTLHDGTEDD